jgi:hypothetical protein
MLVYRADPLNKKIDIIEAIKVKSNQVIYTKNDKTKRESWTGKNHQYFNSLKGAQTFIGVDL